MRALSAIILCGKGADVFILGGYSLLLPESASKSHSGGIQL